MTAEATAGAAAAPAGKDVFGHPRGLWYLSFAEFWERFSYYGMQALLVLYLTHYLLQPGHVEGIWGFGILKGALQGLYGSLATPVATAAAITGVYSAGVYLTPLAGGWLADNVLGRTKTVTLGASLMVLGHFLMAFDVSFVLAILCLFVGVGCFKGNIASQVGELYAINDLRRADGFQIYILGIQLAVIFAPIVTGGLGEGIAWHYGFGAAGVGMALGLAIYLLGRKHLPQDRIGAGAEKNARPKLTSRDWVSIAVLVGLLPVLAASALGNQEIFNAYLLWGDKHYDLTVPVLPSWIPWVDSISGKTLPTSWLVSFDAIISTVTMIAVIAFWRAYGKIRKEPDEIVKMAIGTLISACGPLILAAASAHEAATHEKASLIWGLGFHTLNDIGFAMVFPVGLALYSRVAPPAVSGLFIGVYYLHLMLCNFSTGKIAGLIDTMSGQAFWTMHAAIVGGAGVVLALCAFLFHRILAPAPDDKPATA